jgi:hypothetical protein
LFESLAIKPLSGVDGFIALKRLSHLSKSQMLGLQK